jgi:hypothetical protein
MISDAYSQVDRDYDEDRMHQSLDAGFLMGRITQLSDDRGLYAPLRDVTNPINTGKMSIRVKLAEAIEKSKRESGIKLDSTDTYQQSSDFDSRLSSMVDAIVIEAREGQFAQNHPLQQVFDAVIEQVSKGKGEERHGLGKDFMEQPWVKLCDIHGVGFATGQCGKKLEEGLTMTGAARRRELLGACAYLAMAILHEEKNSAK